MHIANESPAGLNAFASVHGCAFFEQLSVNDDVKSLLDVGTM